MVRGITTSWENIGWFCAIAIDQHDIIKLSKICQDRKDEETLSCIIRLKYG